MPTDLNAFLASHRISTIAIAYLYRRLNTSYVCNVIYTLLQQRNNQKLRNDIVLSIRITLRTPQKASGRLV